MGTTQVFQKLLASGYPLLDPISQVREEKSRPWLRQLSSDQYRG